MCSSFSFLRLRLRRLPLLRLFFQDCRSSPCTSSAAGSPVSSFPGSLPSQDSAPSPCPHFRHRRLRLLRLPSAGSCRLHLWESALLLALAIVLTVGCWASASEAALADRVLRLHVIANSDSPEDQALKLQVRDAILDLAAPWMANVSSRTEAEASVQLRRYELEQAARTVLEQAGSSQSVSVSLEDVWFPTRNYDTFSLPAGRYRALRIVLGEGQGQNWWCVMFPPLCMSSVSEEAVDAAAAAAGLSEDQMSLISGRDTTWVVKFRILEWWDALVRALTGESAAAPASAPQQ